MKCTKDLSVLLLSTACVSTVVSIETNKQTKIKTTINKRKRQARLGGSIYKLFHKGSYLENMNILYNLIKRQPDLKLAKDLNRHFTNKDTYG